VTGHDGRGEWGACTEGEATATKPRRGNQGPNYVEVFYGVWYFVSLYSRMVLSMPLVSWWDTA
jgi:hypothetical protein